jgi:hypothetical protein
MSQSPSIIRISKTKNIETIINYHRNDIYEFNDKIDYDRKKIMPTQINK